MKSLEGFRPSEGCPAAAALADKGSVERSDFGRAVRRVKREISPENLHHYRHLFDTAVSKAIANNDIDDPVLQEALPLCAERVITGECVDVQAEIERRESITAVAITEKYL